MLLQHRPFLNGSKPWYQQLIKKTCHLSTKLTTENSENTFKLKDKIITEQLIILHNKCVATLIEKASGNVAFVYQRLYTQVLIYELGLTNVNNTTLTHMKKNKLVVRI